MNSRHMLAPLPGDLVSVDADYSAALPAWRADLDAGRSSHAQAALPNPESAMTQPIGQGVPFAKTPTSADPMMPEPYWIASTSAETAPARCGAPASAPTMELATMKPVADANTNNAATNPASP